MTLIRLLEFLVILSAPWFLLELFFRLLQCGRKARSRESRLLSLRFLDFVTSPKGAVGDDDSFFTRSTWSMTWETTKLNLLPRAILIRCGAFRSDEVDDDENKVPSEPAKDSSLVRFYDAGVVLAAFSSICSVLFLAWAALRLVSEVIDLHKMTTTPISSYETASIPSISTTENLRKRSYPDANNGESMSWGWSPNIVPLIPGLTIPLSHLMPLLLALVAAQVIHEAGHAICGTLHGLSPLRVGLILVFPIIPGAFVVLSEEIDDFSQAFHHHSQDDIEELGENHHLEDEAEDESVMAAVSRKRTSLRTIAAGVWHNALSAILVAFILWIGVGRALKDLLWVDAGGILVSDVDQVSPLSEHLRGGSLITHLDDLDFSSTSPLLIDPDQRAQEWTSYLLQNDVKDEELDRWSLWSESQSRQKAYGNMGWCVPSSIWELSSKQCCEKFSEEQKTSSPAAPSYGKNGEEKNLLCFKAVESYRSSNEVMVPGRCFDPTRLVKASFGQKPDFERCIDGCSNTASGTERKCIRADTREDLVRIGVQEDAQDSMHDAQAPTKFQSRAAMPYYFSSSPRKSTKTVLFQGPKSSIHDAVRGTAYIPRNKLLPLPLWIRDWVSLCFHYFLNLSVALAMLNMLPIPSLDGDSFLLAALDALLFQRSDIAVTGAGEEGSEERIAMTTGRGRHGESQVPDSISSMSSQRPPSPTAFRRSANSSTAQRSKSSSIRSRLEYSGSNSSRTMYRFPFKRFDVRKQGEREKMILKIHSRARWLASILATFVLGGSIVMALVGDSQKRGSVI